LDDLWLWLLLIVNIIVGTWLRFIGCPNIRLDYWSTSKTAPRNNWQLVRYRATSWRQCQTLLVREGGNQNTTLFNYSITFFTIDLYSLTIVQFHCKSFK
jgi:hypothetical protein